MAKKKSTEAVVARARPLAHQSAHEFQAFNQTVPMPIALSQNVARQSVGNLNQVLGVNKNLRLARWRQV